MQDHTSCGLRAHGLLHSSVNKLQFDHTGLLGRHGLGTALPPVLQYAPPALQLHFQTKRLLWACWQPPTHYHLPNKLEGTRMRRYTFVAVKSSSILKCSFSPSPPETIQPRHSCSPLHTAFSGRFLPAGPYNFTVDETQAVITACHQQVKPFKCVIQPLPAHTGAKYFSPPPQQA